ncbi:hypothetical protein ACFY5H_34180 [Streptomyces sp. NPDC013012]|uniref:hypothetical protein n=1 Tax=Streptomyces sp. NPDC013012 TaxID=3364860 RepID=UPI0036AAF339
MSVIPPRPAPPSRAFLVSRALIREDQLTAAERSARDSVPSPRSPRETARDSIAQLGTVLAKAGWRIETSTHPARVRLEAFHSCGAVVMITSDVRSAANGKARVYYLHPPGLGPWRRLRACDVEHLAQHISLPTGAPEHILGRHESKCHCKKMRYPTQARAAAVLQEVGAIRATQDSTRAPEARYYRCEADDRVWHLTSKTTGYTRATPLAGAFPRPQPRAHRDVQVTPVNPT